MASVLLGFDMCTELSGNALLALMQSTTSFQFPYAVDQDGTHFVIESATLDFGLPDGVGAGTGILTFQGRCGVTTRSDGTTLSGFGAEIVCSGIAVSVQVGGADPWNGSSVDPKKVMFYVDFTELEFGCDVPVVTPTTLGVDDQQLVQDVLEAGFTVFLQTKFGQQKNPSDPTSSYGVFRIDPGMTVNPVLQGDPTQNRFTEVQAIFFGEQNRHSGKVTSLALMQNVFIESIGLGDALLSTRTCMLMPGQDIVVSFSQAVFNVFMFCPGLQSALSEGGGVVPLQLLPTQCGQAESLHNSVSWLISMSNINHMGGYGWLVELVRSTNGIDWQSITNGLNAGSISIEMRCEIDGPCFTLNPDISVNAVPTVSNGKLGFTGTVQSLDLNVSSPWWCWLLSSIVPDSFGLMGLALVDALGEYVGTAVANSIAAKALMKGVSTGQSVPNIPHLAITSFDVTVEALQAVCSVTQPAPPGPGWFAYYYLVSDLPTETETGQFYSSECPVGEFPYTIAFTGSQLVLTPIPYGLYCPPFANTSWTITTNNPTQPNHSVTVGSASGPLYASSGTVEFWAEVGVPDMILGWVEVMTVVQLDYEYTNGGQTLTLTNRLATNGTFSITVSVSSTDLDGRVIQGQGSFSFTGPTLNADPTFSQALAACPNGDLAILLEFLNPTAVLDLSGFTPDYSGTPQAERRHRAFRRALLVDPSFALRIREARLALKNRNRESRVAEAAPRVLLPPPSQSNAQREPRAPREASVRARKIGKARGRARSAKSKPRKSTS